MDIWQGYKATLSEQWGSLDPKAWMAIDHYYQQASALDK
jgi:hypothetical protein